MSAADDSAGGIGRSLTEVNREAVVGNAVADELTTARSSLGDRFVGISSGLPGWKRSGWEASASVQYRA